MSDLSSVDTSCNECGRPGAYILMHADHSLFEPSEFFCETHAVNNKWPDFETANMVRDECVCCDSEHGVNIQGVTFDPIYPLDELDEEDDQLCCSWHP